MITCSAEDQDQSEGKLISRTGGAVVGNILLGGLIGAVADTASGLAFNYLEWVQLVFGKTLPFGRSDYKDAQLPLNGETGSNQAKPSQPLKLLNQIHRTFSRSKSNAAPSWRPL